MNPRILVVTAALALSLLMAGAARADNPTPYSGTMVIKTGVTYTQLIERVNAAVKKNKMGLVTKASATVGAKRALGLTIPGNMVIGVYHPRFAVRMQGLCCPHKALEQWTR